LIDSVKQFFVWLIEREGERTIALAQQRDSFSLHEQPLTLIEIHFFVGEFDHVQQFNILDV
jgi:hypothetical protein